MTPHIRWMISRDMPEVLAIENDVCQCPRDEDDFIRVLRGRMCIGRVAEHDQATIGYMLYELHTHCLELFHIAVARPFQRQGVGCLMIDQSKRKLSRERRKRIVTKVRDSNLTAQLFFRAMGFKATAITPGGWEGTDDDAYVMKYSVNECAGVGVNRIAGE